MTAELVVVVAVIARMPAAELQLAAWGVVFAIATVVQAPAQALLPTSTALAHDAAAFRRLRGYAWAVLLAVSALHLALVVTPAYDALLGGAMGLPPEVRAAARLPLLLMLPWAFGTGYRRFLQGAIIRVGFAGVVIRGTVVRLAVGVPLLLVGLFTQALPGAQVAAAGVIAGVLSELVYVRWRAAALLPRHLGAAAAGSADELAPRRFVAFFWPLVVLALLTMVVQALVTAVLARMPLPLASLAVWPAAFGFLVLWQSPALAYTEAVISLLRRPAAVPALRRFTWTLAALLTVGLGLAVATPLADVWFGRVMGLPDDLRAMAGVATLLALALPGLRVVQSWYQGVIVAAQRTRGISESVVVFLLVVAAGLGVGVAWAGPAGAYVGTVAMVAGVAAQTIWLAWRAAPLLAYAKASDGRVVGPGARRNA